MWRHYRGLLFLDEELIDSFLGIGWEIFQFVTEFENWFFDVTKVLFGT